MPQGLECRLHAGQELAFRLHAVSASMAAATPRHLDLTAVMHWRVLATGDTRWLLAVALDQLELERQPDSPSAGDRAAFVEPFLIEIGRDCRFRRLAFAPRSDARVRSQLEALLRVMEIVLPLAPVRQWTMRQDDAMGSYQGHYELAGGVVFRRRVRYFTPGLPSAGPTLGGPTAEIVDSEARATLDSGGAWLTALSSHDHMKVSLGERPLAEVSGSTDLERIASPPLASLVGLATDRFVFHSPLQAEEGPPEPSFPDAELRAMDLKGALADFEHRLGVNRAGLHDGVATLAGYLSTKPNAINELMVALRFRARAPIDPKLHSVIFLALERTGTPEAEHALATLIGEHRLSSVDRMRAAAALADVPHPSQRAVDALFAEARSSAADDVSRTAVLALGTLQRNTSTTNPGLGDQLREELGARLRAARRSAELLNDIDAVGNSGDISLIDAITRYSEDPSPVVRLHTAEAFARGEGGADEARLVAWLHRELEPRVRRGIVASLAARVDQKGEGLSSELLSGAISALSQEPDTEVRASLIRLLGIAARSVPLAKQVLVEQFHRERQPELLALIGRYCSVADLR